MTFQGLPISTLADTQTWYSSETGELWPCGPMSYETGKGDTVSGVLVIRLGATLELQLVPNSTPVRQSRADHPKAPEMGGLWQDSIRRALDLAKACISRGEVSIGYTKPGESTTARNLREIAPSKNGQAVVGYDMDREAVRSFRLDRIVWVDAR